MTLLIGTGATGGGMRFEAGTSNGFGGHRTSDTCLLGGDTILLGGVHTTAGFITG